MTTPVGGFRERLIMESIHRHVRSCLANRGWFTTDPNRFDVAYLERPVPEGEAVALNTVALFSERTPPQIDSEMGSDLGENHWQWWADIYAEDEAVGVSLSGDVRDILRGRMPSVGADGPILAVYDYSLATPTLVFHCDIENVGRDRPPTYTHPWQQFYFMVSFTIVDEYNGET